MKKKNCLIVEGEPKEVTEIRARIMEAFKDLEFFEEGHKYYLNGEDIPSVSAVVHKFAPEFNEDAIAENYAKKHGETKQYWLDQWHLNSTKATTRGTIIHAFGESLFWVNNGHKELINEISKPQYSKEFGMIPTRPQEEAMMQFYRDLPPSMHFVMNETKVYSGLNVDNALNPKERYCGTFDLLLWYDGEGNPDKSGLVLCDWKTNANLYKEYNEANHKMLYPPFNDMVEEPLSIYTLQLSCYQIPLNDIGLKVLGRRILWVKDDGTYEKIATPDLTAELRSIL